MKMKLWEAGEGLFRTHVTWSELEQRFQDLYGTQAVFGPNKRATNIGDGRGFLSKLCLIEPDFPASLEATKKFVVKIASQITLIEFNELMKDKYVESPFSDPKLVEVMSESLKKVHNSEVDIYNLLAKHKRDNLRIPKIIHGSKFTEENPSRGYLIMEYIEDVENFNIYDNVSSEDIKQALRAVAALEAVSVELTEEELLPYNVNPFVELFAPLFAEESTKSMLSMFRQFAGAEFGERIDRLEKILPQLININEVSKIGETLGMPKIFAHGDVWSTNLLWKKGEKDTLSLAALIDFQSIHLGYPATDLVRVLAACLSGKERQKNWERLLEDFYGYFIEELNGTPAPYTLEQLKESYRRFFPLGAFMLVPVIGPLFEMNNNNPDEELRIKITEAIMEKSRCLLDDIFENFERNQKIKEQEAEQ